MPLFRAGKPYHGRLAFDGHDHIDPKGRKLSTDGEGNYWYKRRGEKSHLEKFHQRFVVVDATTAADSHHTGVVLEDAHANGVQFHDDEIAPTVTSHTEAK